MKAQIATRSLLRSIPDKEKPSYEVSVALARVLLQRGPSTLMEALRKHADCEGKSQPIPPLDPASLPFVKKLPPVYTVFDLLAFTEKAALARGLKPADQNDTNKYPGAVGAVLGFQARLGAAGPEKQWSFATQPDGRPRDLIAAQLAGDGVKDTEWLTIREFGRQCADAASRSASAEEAHSLGAAARRPKPAHAARKAPTVSQTRAYRWGESGGPI